ncbi:hypothetical protein IKG24_00145 [Candidatus Saccharibacteria bacterium]|nr:hypothetical protein [Candidatus Saccharibacteria bacterium]
MKRHKKKERILPMPTEEDKLRAKLKAKSADPLVWAMKSVDEKFPDEREKTIETVEAEAAIEEDTRLDDEAFDDETIDDEVVDNESKTDDSKDETSARSNSEIKAEGKTVLPMDDGAMTVEVTPMRQNMDGVSRDDEKVKNVKPIEKAKVAIKPDDQKTQVKLTALESKQKRMMFALIALVVLAFGGMAFGIIAMINQNHATLELANQIVGAGASENKVDDDYMYIKDWGMKIKVISGLSNVSFAIDDDEYGSIMVWGARKDSGANYVPDFAKQAKNIHPMGTLVRVPRYERSASGRLIWYDDYYNYYYQGPVGEPEASEVEMSWWVESYLLIKEMLTNADNYVAIDDSTIGQQ